MRTIGIGFDGSDASQDALRVAGRLAAASGAQLVLLGAYRGEARDAAGGGGDLATLERVEVEQRLELAATALHGPVRLRAVGAPTVARALATGAAVEAVDLLVVGATHRGRFGRVMPGSTVAHLLHDARCPIAVVPHRADLPRGVPWRFAVGNDGGPEAAAAVTFAARMARATGAALRLVAVAEPPPLPVVEAPGLAALAVGRHAVEQERVRAARQAGVGRAAASVPAGIHVEPLVLDGDPAVVLAGQAHDADLLVMGSRGRGPLGSVMLGSTAAAVLRMARVPVVVVPRRALAAVAA